jgi:ABC-type multidrug transport system ATPase subunit
MLLSIRWNDTGVLNVLGQSVKSEDRKHLRDIAFLSHDVQFNGSQKICDFLDFHSFFYPNYSKKIETELLGFFELDQSKKIAVHSTGQQKKIQIVAGLAAQTKLVIIDEVTAVLDPDTRNKFFQLLEQHNKEFNKTIILATNLVNDLAVCSSKILYIKKGSSTIHEPHDIGTLFKTKNG